MTATYALALGSNRRGRHGPPAAELRAALHAIGGVVAVSAVITTPPLGPSTRRFANAVALIASDEPPPVFLKRLKAIETTFGRRPGRRWGARVVDLDIVLWSEGVWRSPDLTVPHRLFRGRDFVLAPLRQVSPDWRDPQSGLTIRQLAGRLGKRRPRCGDCR
jgi:2-amino-4-hydroxy-6-hydroxymethyldihydropteridine diphosphokinase